MEHTITVSSSLPQVRGGGHWCRAQHAGGHSQRARALRRARAPQVAIRRLEQRRDPGQQHGGRGRGGESSRHPGNSGPFERGVRGGAGDGTFEKPISEVWILHWKPEIGNWNVYPDDVKFAKHVFRENNIATYFIMPPQNRRKTHLFSTLNARNNMMTGKFS